MTAVSTTRATTLYLNRPGGRIAYDLQGSGPLAICIPGMGDVRSVYRFLAPALAEAGLRVATMDLRGHGMSDASFETYDDVAAGSDLIALAEHLGGPAIFIGNSMGAGAACWAAAERRDLAASLVLLGPFVRDGKADALSGMMFRVALLRPWGRAVWRAYFKRLYPVRRGGEFEAHLAEVTASLRKSGYWDAFRLTARTSHAPVEARLDAVHAPTLVVMGGADPDFPDPSAEATWIAERLGAQVVMVAGAGHYPQAEFPEIVTPAVVEFVLRVDSLERLAHLVEAVAQRSEEQSREV
jgi:pimeloyl-ACP methyl ester carboxylesterase